MNRFYSSQVLVRKEVKMKQFEVHERKNLIERIMFSVDNAVIDFLRSQSV